ncbi:MAG: pantetheine-phosphate adenylyltransferase [Coriobacteriia bacterium]|nr:pantetheine-phosphate adenylyltransferase [Coriobacteriia bacterium]
MKKALVPGTFDPITNGHLDIITRAASIFDEVVVAVALSAKKNTLFPLDRRVELVEEAVKDLPNVTVKGFDGLLTDFAFEQGAHCVVKGLRAITDFEYEFQMAAMNWQLHRAVETFFIMSPPEYMYLSSSIVRELASMNGKFEKFVPENVVPALKEAYSK